MANDADTAMRLGREAGAIPERCAGDCPHGHAALGLRIAWMDGFSQGRAEMQAATGSGPAVRVLRVRRARRGGSAGRHLLSNVDIAAAIKTQRGLGPAGQ